MLREWRKARIHLSEGRHRAKIRLLGELAYRFSCENKEIFSVDELYDNVEEYLQGSNVSTVFKHSDGNELIIELSEEDGVIQKLEREDDRYIFLHQTFQEYLTASYLNRAKDGIELATQYLWDYDWHETLSLFAD